ncbi:DUF5672 family protein [Empedobacter sp. GD03865]|uniref:DUF5672 family protein n=1 Tax=Empedobacter sp. GD03865 TaxID=2975392 RepID=UPI00244C329D|nr:DUF5672 family protein [Empedobacter sp. GD03865]MDH0659578.1 hypothetical protein [Empedobacter sp. GD03865]
MKKQIIIIPIYKIQLTAEEVISLKQCFKILGNHTIKFVAPVGLNTSSYESILQKSIEVEYFDAIFFENISGYNKLMLSLDFYRRFESFAYMLVYQLDCYVFRDELAFWCNKGFDYIGAPWLEKSYYIKTRSEKLKFLIRRFFNLKMNKYFNKDILVYQVGNGGFSLRKINKFIYTLQHTNPKIINKFKESNDPMALFNEDVFWSFEAKNIKKPKYKMSTKFGLDSGADIGIRLNQGLLPFGCHAWHKNKAFWSKYIEL